MMLFFRILQHLLPNGRAWSTTITKPLRAFVQALADVPARIREYIDRVYLDAFPQTTRELDAQEAQWGLPDTGLSEQERRDRIAAQWSTNGGQSPAYLEGVLQANGFAVYLHEWWQPGTNPPVARDPNDYIAPSDTGYPLVNKQFTSSARYIALCGVPVMQCGEPDALCGNIAEFTVEPVTPPLPSNPDAWPYFLYIGGETFPNLASVPAARQGEFEELCLKICPAQQWLGILVQYV